MNTVRTILILGLTALLGAGCSTQWREGDAGVTPEELFLRIENAKQNGGVSGIFGMVDQGDTNIFYAASGPGMPAASVVGLWSFAFLGVGSDFDWTSVQDAEVFFLDQVLDGQRHFGLVVGIKKWGDSAMSYYGAEGSGTISAGELRVNLGRAYLSSYDVDESGELGTVIQLRAYDAATGGYIGKFPQLVGFRP